MNKLVSVVIPTIKGREKLLQRAIASVRNQTYKNIEIIVVNEGKPAQEQRNIGVDRAKGDFIAFLDDDDYWGNKSFLKKMITKLEEENLNMISCGYYDERRKSNRLPDALTSNDLLISFSNFETSATIFIKDAYYRVGGLDKRFRTEQNHDLFYRIAKLGKFGIIKEVMTTKGYVINHIGGNRIDKLQGYVLFHIKYLRDIFNLPLRSKLFVILKFFLVVSTMGVLLNPKIYEVYRGLKND